MATANDPIGMAPGNPPNDPIDGPYAWGRVAVSLAIATIGGIGLWSAVVVLPTIQTEFGVGRGGASIP